MRNAQIAEYVQKLVRKHGTRDPFELAEKGL